MHRVLLAVLPDGSALKDWVLLFAGNAFAALFATRALGHWFKKEWGLLITMSAAAVFVGAAIWFPEGVKTLLVDVWGKITGSA